MSKDILAEWKTKKFVVSDEVFDSKFCYSVILTDTHFWYNAYDDLIKWVGEVGGEVSGMVVSLPNEAALTVFCLKWR